MKRFTLAQVAQRLDGTVDGDPGREVTGLAPLESAGEEHLSFLANPRYRPMLDASRAGCVIVAEDLAAQGRDLIRVRDPYLGFAQAMDMFYGDRPPAHGVSEQAHVHPEASIGSEVTVEPFVFIDRDAVIGNRVRIMAGTRIGAGARVGDDTVIHANVAVEDGCIIGRRCIVHAGCVLGSDGFGFAADGPRHRKILQAGIVRVGDDVEIGAGCTVDRATLGETVIGDGTKMDNLVHVAHNVTVGSHCLLVAQVGLAGSATLGDHVVMAGQSGVAGHLSVGNRAVIMAKTAVLKDVPAGAVMAGIPAIDAGTWKRSAAVFSRLDSLKKQMARLEKEMDRLKKRQGEESK